MNRYHKELYFPNMDNENLRSMIDKLNSYKFSISFHAFDKVKDRISNSEIETLGFYLRDLVLDYNNLFEYYKKNDSVFKLVFRFSYDNETDLIIVLNEYKKVITLYFNNNNDSHSTLDSRQYAMA